MDDWVRFKMTTTALKAVDHYGGIDNYVLSLDEASVKDSNYITKVRAQICTELQKQNKLPAKMAKQLGGLAAFPWYPIKIIRA